MPKGMLSPSAEFILLALISCLPTTACVAQRKKEETTKPSQSIAELRQQLEKILTDTHTPGLSVAIVHKDSLEWIAGLGESDMATHHATTDETLFRIGSASKTFVSLPVLKLVNEGKVSLQDPVHKLAPEIWFENRWKTTDPVRVVDLLEHTTGWDDWHIPEYAKDGKNMTLLEGLNYYRTSRISRWPPGTRMSYCNSGPAVAAYIVEKITELRFEDYVTQTFFVPIGMKTATWFEQPKPHLATLYDADGRLPYPYWNLLERPTGSVNASARDMAAYLQFYLNRGSVGETKILPPASIKRMETPTRAWEAQEGLETGYGLGSYVIIHDGFVYHGHEGTVNGGSTELWYLPESGVGYFFSTNSANTAAAGRIGKSIRAYITRKLTRAEAPAVGQLPADAAQYEGWYVSDAPRFEITHFMSNLATLRWVSFPNGIMRITSLVQKSQAYVPFKGRQFRYLPKNEHGDPIPTAVLLPATDEGRYVFLGGPLGGTMKRVPTGLIVTQLALATWVLVAMASILIYAPFWIVGGVFAKRRRPGERALRLWPLVAALSVLASLAIFGLHGNRLGSLTIWSLSLFLFTLLFAVASACSVVALWLARRRQVRRFVRWHSISVTLALMIAVAYFAYWGMIGLRTWA